MSHYRPYHPPQPLLFGYDPMRDLPADHLARLIDYVVEASIQPPPREPGPGQPPFDPRLCIKVLIYAYATGIRSSRVMERQCQESLPFLFLTRGDAPSYRTLCTVRTQEGQLLETVWEGLFTIAGEAGLERLGRIAVDSTKLRADASPDAVVKRKDFLALRAELRRILDEAEAMDAREAAAGATGAATLGKVVPQEQMREILRRVRKQRHAAKDAAAKDAAAGAAPAGTDPAGSAEPPVTGILALEVLPPAEPAALADTPPDGVPPAEPPLPMTPRMLKRVKAGLEALDAALADGRKHLCLTDPDARMMYGGRVRSTRECYSWEVAVDNGLLVAAQATQDSHDNTRLEPLVEAARKHEPAGITAVDADSGYYTGEAVAALIRDGLDTCIPDSNTACDLHRGQPIGTTGAKSRGKVPLTYDAAEDVYRCPEGNTLAPTQHRRTHGQELTVYRAQAACGECPQRSDCLTNPQATHRTTSRGDDHDLLEAARQRFAEPEHQDRYHHRAEAVETIFGFLRGTLGFLHWCLRGADKVATEAKLFTLAYQVRKVQRALTAR